MRKPEIKADEIEIRLIDVVEKQQDIDQMNIWAQDAAEQLKIKLDPSQAPVGADEEEEPAEPDYAAFKGVKFSE